MTYAEKQILPALIPIIEANNGELCTRAIPEYVLLLFATGGFKDKAEIKAAFNSIYRRGVFRLKGEKQMKTIITDEFLINMLTSRSTVQFRPLSLTEAKEFFLPGYLGKKAEWESAVGHPDTAVVFSQQLGFEVEAKRTTIQLDYGTRLIVGQYNPPKPPKGAWDMNGADFQWWLVTRGATGA